MRMDGKIMTIFRFKTGGMGENGEMGGKIRNE